MSFVVNVIVGLVFSKCFPFYVKDFSTSFRVHMCFDSSSKTPSFLSILLGNRSVQKGSLTVILRFDGERNLRINGIQGVWLEGRDRIFLDDDETVIHIAGSLRGYYY